MVIIDTNGQRCWQRVLVGIFSALFGRKRVVNVEFLFSMRVVAT